MTDPRFDDIRPYDDHEVPAAMQRIADNEAFPLISNYIYPGREIAGVRQLFKSIGSVNDLQNIIMPDVVEALIAKGTDGFTWDGLHRLDKGRNYLFVSNHRDIVLAAMLQQYALWKEGFDTAEITFGANLMSGQLITDIGRANKMFRVERPRLSVTSPREFYKSSLHLSDYLHYCITEKKQSVWIAQRNGRTKNGVDATDSGIIKMFTMGHPDDKVESLAELNIVPMSISYEWEPCDVLKALEIYESARSTYTKKPGEDLNSIMTGLVSKKGRVHINFGELLSRPALESLSGLTLNQYCKDVAAILDRRICLGYKLMPNNYIAHDLLYGDNACAPFYNATQKEAFLEHMSVLERYDTCDRDELREIFLGIYANPVDSVRKFSR